MNTHMPERSPDRPNTLGLPSRPLDALLDRMDSPTEAKAVARRQFTRWPFRQTTIRTTIMHPGGSTVQLRLACRNLSSGGIALLHTSYVHPGSACSMYLPTAAGGEDHVQGVVQRCSHLRGTLHEIGIKFRQPIELARYISSDRAVIEHVNPKSLAGLALLAESSADEVENFKRLLEGTSVRVRDFRTGAELLAHGTKDVSIIVCGDTLPDMTGTELLARLRKAEADVPVMILSAKPAGADAPLLRRQRAVVLQRPLSADALLRTVAELTLLPPPVAGRGPRSQPSRSAP